MKWFNFAGQGSKLERVESGAGHFALMLSISNSRFASLETDANEIERQGWLAVETPENSKDRMYLNHRLVHSARDVASSLRAFFSEKQIRQAFVDLDQLVQGEQVLGLRDRSTATPDDFLGEMQGVERNNLSRIRETIVRARAQVEKMNTQSQQQPLNGRGLAFVQFVGSLGEPELAAAAVFEAIRDFNPALESVISNFEEHEADLPAKLQMMVHDNRVDLVRQHVSERSRQTAIMTGKEESRTSAAIHFLRYKVPVLAMEPANDSPGTDSLQTINMQVRSDKSLSRIQYMHALDATRKAVIAIGQLLNRSPDELFPNQKGTILRISRKAATSEEGVMGQASRMGDAEDDIGAIQSVAISAEFGGSVVHELGHVLHDAHGLSAAEMRQVIEESGVRGRVLKSVLADKELGLISDDMADYMMLDQEIWARSFEAALVNRAVAAGDTTLETIGGLTAAHLADEYSPTGDHGLSEKFAAKMTEMLDQKRSALQQDRSASIEP